MPYFEKITRSGRLLEVERYFATRDGRRIARGENRAESSEEMERLNERNARRKLMRLINANFSGAAGDLFVTLTHAQPVDEAQAAKEERNMLLRIARARERKGLDALKYIAITECQSGRWHHHLILLSVCHECRADLYPRRKRGNHPAASCVQADDRAAGRDARHKRGPASRPAGRAGGETGRKVCQPD